MTERAADARGGLFRTRFPGDAVDPAERAAAFAAALLGGIESRFITDTHQLSAETWLLVPLSLMHVRASPRRTARGRERIATDLLDAIGMQLTLAGTAVGDGDGRAIRTGPGDLLFLDSTRPMEVRDETDREGLTIWCPRDVFVLIEPRPERLHGCVFGPDRNALVAGFLRSLLPTLGDLKEEHGPALARVILDLVALMIDRPTLGGGAPSIWGDEVGGLAAVFDRATAWIDEHLDGDVTPEDVATGLGVSRSRLYEAFEPTGGVARHIVRRRLRSVYAMLLNPEEARSVAELAYAGGFRSHTHFARVFREQFGLTPGALRKKIKDERG